MKNEGHEATQKHAEVVSEVDKHRLELEKLDLEKQQHQLEILKTLHEAGLERWKDRRENEWKLNYAIWGAIAGLDALLLHDQPDYGVPVPWLIAGGAACVFLHLTYLWPTISRALADIQLQSDVEHAMVVLILDKKVADEIDEGHLGGRIRRFERSENHERRGGLLSFAWKRYGLIAPILFTIALLTIGGVLLSGKVKAQKKPDDKGSVVNYFTVPDKP